MLRHRDLAASAPRPARRPAQRRAPACGSCSSLRFPVSRRSRDQLDGRRPTAGSTAAATGGLRPMRSRGRRARSRRTSTRPTSPPSASSSAQHRVRVHAVGVERRLGRPSSAAGTSVGLDDVHGAGRARRGAWRRPGSRCRSRRAARRPGACPRMPKSATRRRRAAAVAGQPAATSTPKPSSPRKMLPMPATRTRAASSARGRSSERLDLVGAEVAGSGRASAAGRRAGSSSRVTARCAVAVDVAAARASTVASRPARNMSWASARAAPGRSRTRLPRPTVDAADAHRVGLRDTEASAPGSHQRRELEPAVLRTAGLGRRRADRR